MLNSGKKNILTLVLSEKKILNEAKNHTPPPPPPCELNGRSLMVFENNVACSLCSERKRAYYVFSFFAMK